VTLSLIEVLSRNWK